MVVGGGPYRGEPWSEDMISNAVAGELEGIDPPQAGGHPATYDKEAYKRRNVVECSFNTLKQWRSLARRYDKLALTDRSAIVLHAVLIWSAAIAESALGDTP